MTDTPIRTYATEVVAAGRNRVDLDDFPPTDWKPGTPVLAVAGLPEDAVVVPAWGDTPPPSEVDEGDIVATIVVPKPVPAPCTEWVTDLEAFHNRRLVLREGAYSPVHVDRIVRFVDDNGSPNGAAVQDADGQWLADVNDKGRVEVLVDPAPTEGNPE